MVNACRLIPDLRGVTRARLCAAVTFIMGVWVELDVDKLVRTVEMRQARRLVLKNAAVIGGVYESAKSIMRNVCNCQPSDVDIREVLVKTSLRRVSDGADPLYVLIPRRAYSPQQVEEALSRIRQAVELWRYAYGTDRHHALDEVVAAILHRTLSRDEYYHESPLEWYHGVLVEEYNIADEVRYGRKGTVFRIGDVKIRRVRLYCHDHECYGYMRIKAVE